MDLFLKILVHLHLLTGVLCQVTWLPCQFIDEHVFLNNDNHTETTLIHKEALLQFGQKGDAPLNPDGITFLVTGSKLDLRRFLEEVEPEHIECDIRRYSTGGIHVRWPVQAAHEFNRWYTCNLRDLKNLVTVIGFLRQASDQAPSGADDYRSWPAIHDREILTTTVAMVTKTRSPMVKVGLGSEQKLHCQFAVDHKGPDISVEWKFQLRGDRQRLFSYSSRTGRTEGSGVKVKSLTSGDASYSIPFTKMNNEGRYICSVSVNPLFSSLDVFLHIEVAPRVSLNIGPTLSLLEGDEQKVICEAEGYYPLDVDIFWFEQDPSVSNQRVGAPLPKALKNILLSSHKHNMDKTYTLSAFFYLKASLRDSGRQFTCSVSHPSLRLPIKKSFVLTVEEPINWMFYLSVGFILVSLLTILYLLLLYLRSVKRSDPKKPY